MCVCERFGMFVLFLLLDLTTTLTSSLLTDSTPDMQSATFGPFDRQVLIMNTDEKTFTILENPQAMRLKKAGFIQDRRFVKQPTAEELASALEPDGGGLVGAIQGIFGGGGGSSSSE